MATYCPGPSLAEQIASFDAQTHRPISLIISDDTPGEPSDFLHQETAKFSAGPARIAVGPRTGFALNFLSLLRHAGPEVPYAALSDQDDVWLPEKLSRAVAQLGDVPANVPAVYCSRTWECGPQLQRLQKSRMPGKSLGFPHALVQNVVSGNTIVLNRAALDILQPASLEAMDVIAHDWWIYQMISGVGGQVIFDETPTVLYRQHDSNLIGANRGTRAAMQRLMMVAQGEFARWNDINIAAMRRSAHRFTPENRRFLALFARARRRPILARVSDLKSIGVYRQTTAANAAFWGAVALGKL